MKTRLGQRQGRLKLTDQTATEEIEYTGHGVIT